jgi:Tfp pilus assembly protein PilF
MPDRHSVLLDASPTRGAAAARPEQGVVKRHLIAILLSATAWPALAQSGVTPPFASEQPASTAVTTLVRQAERWLAQGRPDLAQLSAARALAAEPSNVEALLAAARVETARNNREGALAYLRRAAAGGTEEQRLAATAAQRSLSLDQAALDQARRLAREGRNDEASARYRAIFAGGPGPEYAREYYQALAGSAGTRAEGIAGLSRLADAPNADATTRLATAAALTYQESTRAEGIGRLRTLADRPETAAAAQQSWRQALSFGGSDPATAPQIEAYLARFPNDTELVQRLQSLRRTPSPPLADTRQDTARREGVADLETGGLRTAGRSQASHAPGLSEAPRSATSLAATPAYPSPPRPNDRTAQLRAEAAQTADAAVATTLLRSAVALAPLDPWPRLDLARALKRQGRGPEARALVEELAAQSNTADAHFAAALLAQEDGRIDDAEGQLNAIAPARRTPDMSRLQARIRTERDIARAGTGGTLNAGDRQALMAFGTAGDRASAIEASRVALAANAGAGPAARLAVAGALLGADADSEATALSDQLNGATLSADQRRDLASLRSGIAIRAADRLNETGAQAQAFERLRPVIAENPDNPDVKLALARLYQGARQPSEALTLAQSVLARDPRNFAARQGAVDAAIALGDRRTAEILVAEAQASNPNDSRLTYLRARVAGSFGNTTQAKALLQQSLDQRQAELGTDPAPRAGANGTSQPNPFLHGTTLAATGSAPNDELTRQILRDIKIAETNNAPQVSFGPSLHIRSGSPGLDQLTALSATIEGQIAAPGIGGRLVVKADPVLLNSGQIGSTLATLQRFGTNPVLGAGAVTPKNTSASGMGLGIGYTLRDVIKLSAGTSPLGFKSPSLIGSFEVAPRITDTLRLRVTADRHAMTDSLLSWAGLTDPSSRITWGSVVSSGGRAQIEGPMGRGSFYVGGGHAVLTGQHVAGNNRTEAGTGFAYPLLKDPNGELTAGADLVYFGFANNQRAYTLGNGGYFSPQSYGAINIPLDYRGKSGDLDYRVGVSAGYATFRESSNAVFPNNPDLQRQLERAAASNSLLITRTPALTRNGFVGGVRVDLAYQLTPTLSLAGSLRYDQAPQFDETNVLVKLLGKF